LLADLGLAAQAVEESVPSLVIIGRRDVRSNNSWMHNLPTLAKGPMRCTLLVHPTDASRLSLVNGRTARLRRPDGRGEPLMVEVRLSDEVMPGVVSLPHGWGHDLAGTRLRLAELHPGANLNALLDDDARDPLSGNAVLSGVEVLVEPA
jgi:anaerobic selenocysteine-containing dehydrogenase